MRILVVTATDAEIAPLTAALTAVPGPSSRLRRYTRGAHAIDVLATGVGMVATAAWCSGLLARERYDVAVNAGVCGSFRAALPPGSVVHVASDRLAELGAEDGNTFLSIHDLQLLGPDEFPFTGRALVNATPPENHALQRLPVAAGITVSTAHGCEASIDRVVARYDPDVESMEGAAFMYACLIHGVPFAQVRAVSNIVERRNRAAWKLQEAVDALGTAVLGIIDDVRHAEATRRPRLG